MKKKITGKAIRKKTYRRVKGTPKRNWWQRRPLLFQMFIIFFGVVVLFQIIDWCIPDSFNPETDVCLVHECRCFDENGLPPQDEDCTDHRPKTFCEKCADDWSYTDYPMISTSTSFCEQNCVCDEWEEDIWDYRKKNLDQFCMPCDLTNCKSCVRKPETWINNNGSYEIGWRSCCNYWIVESDNCLSAFPKLKPIKINLETEKCVEHTFENVQSLNGGTTCDQYKDYKEYRDSEKRMTDKYCCIKKEPKNECEKGNPDYVWDEYYIYNIKVKDTEWNNVSDELYKLKKTCREKTIEDLTCDELFDTLLERHNNVFNIVAKKSIS